MIKDPPCAEWNIWKGPEIEGHSGLGESTLFIRSFAPFPTLTAQSDFSFLKEKSGCSRVWFCKEFQDWKMMRAVAKHFRQVCIEVEPRRILAIPKKLREIATLYIKVDLAFPLKPGDHVCIGPRFADESFAIGTGRSVKPEQYRYDTKIA